MSSGTWTWIEDNFTDQIKETKLPKPAYFQENILHLMKALQLQRDWIRKSTSGNEFLMDCVKAGGSHMTLLTLSWIRIHLRVIHNKGNSLYIKRTNFKPLTSKKKHFKNKVNFTVTRAITPDTKSCNSRWIDSANIARLSSTLTICCKGTNLR